MLLVNKLVLFVLFHIVIASPQINLDLTEWISESDIVLQHDCLHVAASIVDGVGSRQIISYCMSEWPSKWNIQKNDQDQIYRFAELYKQNITSEHLYIWSAPTDVIERYQLYLNKLSISNESFAMETQLFYNCTSPRFGPQCQYSLDAHEPYHLSLDEIVHGFYEQMYEPQTLTCYTHLKCHHGFALSCLDWSDICDGKVNCINDAIDEEHCWQLQINKCEDNEYRCDNGQCIPSIFFRDDNGFECLDRSDENHAGIEVSGVKTDPIFSQEDITCKLELSGFSVPFTSSCVYQRNILIIQLMFSHELNTTYDECLAAFKCHFHIPTWHDPKCYDICQNERCKEIINENCPEMFYVPAVPILFGHVYFAFTKEYAINSNTRRLSPQYICYNDHLCGGFYSNKTLLSFNNATCRRPEDFPLLFDNFPVSPDNWITSYVEPVYDLFIKFNTIVYNNSVRCDRSINYQCINSSKCISNFLVGDGRSNCDYNDDEQQFVIDEVCLTDRSGAFFNCTTTNKCISNRNLQNMNCDCGWDAYGLCDDENPTLHYITKHVSFPTICDGFTELIPLLNDDGKNNTDETDCDYWQCNNTYTRCDGFWNCLNGADEIDCDSSPSLKCPPYHHICVSPKTFQLMCLPIEKANNGNIDCVGATDEPSLCRAIDYRVHHRKFHCMAYLDDSCTSIDFLCDDTYCSNGIDKQFCEHYGNRSFRFNFCYRDNSSIRSDIENFLCQYLADTTKPQIVYFSLEQSKNSNEDFIQQNTNVMISDSSVIPTIRQYPQRCYRGLVMHVWLNNEQNLTTTTCLCPPSFYGDMCQYQNQRVSLTMRLQTSSDSFRIPFILVVLLIDDSDERIIHSHQQFTYLYIQDCSNKFNTYLLYATRPKNQTKQYSVHIDIYEKILSTYRGSFLIPLKFSFLPVYRVAALLYIPSIDDGIRTCSNQPCVYGRCIHYLDNQKDITFCRCQHGWSGRYCDIPYNCTCSLDSQCIGILPNNRSLCVCSNKKWGSQCLFPNTICYSDQNTTCLNGGQCISVDEHVMSNRSFICICPKHFTGDRCELSVTQIVVTFHDDIVLPSSIVFYFIRVMNNAAPENGSTFRTTALYHNSVTVYWLYPFHIMFAEFSTNNFYLIIVQKTYNQSATILRTINSSDRCKHINELFNETIIHDHLIRRIKYYHLPCQTHTPLLSCFHDDTHFCLCYDFGNHRVANCFEFNHTIQHNCFGQNNCQNGAKCVQDKPFCAQTSVCVCPPCYYGTQCQFNANLFGLSLDAILGYHIQPHVAIIHQPSIVQFSLALTIIMTLLGLIDGISAILAFKNKKSQTTGCGLYLLGSSITTLFTIIIFALKFSILIVAQMTYMTNRSFLQFQCYSFDFLLRVCLNMDQWLNACIALERVMATIKGVSFDKKKSKRMAKYIILVLIILNISTIIHDPIHRQLIDDNDDDANEKRTWCIVTYSSSLRVFNSAINTIHFLTPFIINLISAVIIIIMTTRQRIKIQTQQIYLQVFCEQIRRHKHVLIGPIVLAILAVPRLIISFITDCMKSGNNSWLLIIGYFISFIPSMLTFVLFVVPSKLYVKEFYKSLLQCQRKIQRRFHCAS